MKTKIIDTITGKEYENIELPLLQKGMLIALSKAFAGRRVTDVWLYIGADESERSQVAFAGLMDTHNA